MNNALTLDELRALPATIDLPTAARALGMGRTKAYELAKRDQFPCRILHIGSTYRIPTAELLRYLGIETTQDAQARHPFRSVESARLDAPSMGARRRCRPSACGGAPHGSHPPVQPGQRER